MKIYINLLIESHFYLFIFVLITHFVELLTGFRMFVRWFLFKKDLKTAHGTASRETLLYFIYNIGFAVYKVYFSENTEADFYFFIWVVIIIFLSILFRKLYNKYQGIDENKPDWMGIL